MIHLVRDLDEAVSYYSKLFASEPHKRRPGYANFAIDNPPLKLVLFENPRASERLNHLGVEVFEPADVEDAARRLGDAGILTEIQRDETCCHATQDKVWSNEPQGLRWEWYRITDDEPETKPMASKTRSAGFSNSLPGTSSITGRPDSSGGPKRTLTPRRWVSLPSFPTSSFVISAYSVEPPSS